MFVGIFADDFLTQDILHGVVAVGLGGVEVAVKLVLGLHAQGQLFGGQTLSIAGREVQRIGVCGSVVGSIAVKVIFRDRHARLFHKLEDAPAVIGKVLCGDIAAFGQGHIHIYVVPVLQRVVIGF